MDWRQAFGAYHGSTTVTCLVLALVVLAVRLLAHRSPLAHRLDGSFNLIVVGLLCGALAPLVAAGGMASVSPYLDAVFEAAVAIGVVRAGVTVFVDFYLRQRQGAVVSVIFRDIASVVTYFLVIVVVLRATLDINLASLIATSAVLTVILGLALQDVLSNLFAGIVLELEQPFSPGDWVRVGTIEGVVKETGWRTTKIRTRVNELVTLPNSAMSKDTVLNYSRPDPLHGDTLFFDAAYEAPPNVVKAAVMGVLDADPSVVRSPRAEVRLTQYSESSIHYAIRYWITDYGALEQIRNRILTNIWYALGRANVRMPFPARDVFVYTGSAPSLQPQTTDLVGLLRRLPLLAWLDDAELDKLARRVRRLTYGADEIVVREGDPGDSFYVIERGEALVTLEGDMAAESLKRLARGSFFGEMSLLTGAPRTATVRACGDLGVIEIDRAAFKEVLMRNPTILAPLSEIVAEREAAQDLHRSLRETGLPGVRVDRSAQGLGERIKAFFGL